MSKLSRAIEELARRAAQGDEVARQDIFDEAARLTSQGFPEDTAMRIATGELPMDAASRNARAVEQGYDPFETWYHGTADDITAFDPAKSQSRDFGHAGKGTYVASHPGIARAYANTAAGSADANIMPLRTSANNPLRISLEEKQALGQAGPSATARLQQQAISEGFDSIEVIMPNGEILEKVIFDPANIRSTNAAFDPANKGRSALLGGLGGAAVVGGTMTPEEAQAGPLSAGARRIIDPRFSQPVGGGTTRKGVLTDLEGMETAVDQRQMDIGSPKELYDYEGSPYILTQSDRSAAGGVLTGVGGKEIDPVNLRGGRDFMFDPESSGMVWASDPVVVKSMYKRALELRKEFGKDPILLPYTMAPTGVDFATMPLDTMINYARQGMSKANIKKLDSQIKKVIPSWKGVMNPEANAVFREVHGNKRKDVANIIDKNFRDVNGGLSIGEARAATSDTAQYMAPDGSIQNIGTIEISDSSSALQASDHPTYRGGLRGQGEGKLRQDINARTLMEGKGRELTGDAADIRALSMNHQLSQGIVDENLLRKIYDNQGPRIEAISKKFGVSIPIAAMALMGEPEEAQAGPISSGIKRLASAYEKVASPQAEGVARMVEQGQISPEQADKYTNTIKAYKLFRTKGGNTDELFPLFVNANKPVNMGEWNPAESGLLTDAGKVKSSIGPLAYRPGWHAGDAPVATHIGGKSDSSLKAPDYRPADQVWAEVEMPADVDWQSVADSRMEYSKAGNPIPRTAQITDQIPEGGYYRYKTNPNMTGDWLIAGDMKVNRVLTPSEVYQINAERGVHDLPPVDDKGKMLWSLALGSGLTAAGVAPEEAKAELLSEVPQEQAQQLQDNWSQIEANAQAGMGGMGVRSAPVTQDEEAIMAAQQPESTGADLMRQANDDFMSGIVNQPEPDFLGSVQQSLLSGIMKTAGIADLSADFASAMVAPVMSAPGAVARYAAGSTADEIAQARRETEDYFNYQPRTELGPQYGEQAMQAIGGAVSPYIPAIKKAAGESYILGAMKQGYDYLGEREKELAKALMDLSPY